MIPLLPEEQGRPVLRKSGPTPFVEASFKVPQFSPMQGNSIFGDLPLVMSKFIHKSYRNRSAWLMRYTSGSHENPFGNEARRSKNSSNMNIPQQVYRLSEKAVPPFRGKCTAYPPRCTAYSLGYDVKII
jgi:hypothetical protein